MESCPACRCGISRTSDFASEVEGADAAKPAMSAYGNLPARCRRRCRPVHRPAPARAGRCGAGAWRPAPVARDGCVWRIPATGKPHRHHRWLLRPPPAANALPPVMKRSGRPRPPMGDQAHVLFGDMQPVRSCRQLGIAGDEQIEPALPCDAGQRLRQRLTPRRIAIAQHDQAAAGKPLCRREGIGKTGIVRHQHERRQSAELSRKASLASASLTRICPRPCTVDPAAHSTPYSPASTRRERLRSGRRRPRLWLR